jgi:hypothetical protein
MISAPTTTGFPAPVSSESSGPASACFRSRTYFTGSRPPVCFRDASDQCVPTCPMGASGAREPKVPPTSLDVKVRG